MHALLKSRLTGLIIYTSGNTAIGSWVALTYCPFPDAPLWPVLVFGAALTSFWLVAQLVAWLKMQGRIDVSSLHNGWQLVWLVAGCALTSAVSTGYTLLLYGLYQRAEVLGPADNQQALTNLFVVLSLMVPVITLAALGSWGWEIYQQERGQRSLTAFKR